MEGGQGKGVVLGTLDVGLLSFDSSLGLKVDLIFLTKQFRQMGISGIGGNNRTWW